MSNTIYDGLYRLEEHLQELPVTGCVTDLQENEEELENQGK